MTRLLRKISGRVALGVLVGLTVAASAGAFLLWSQLRGGARAETAEVEPDRSEPLLNLTATELGYKPVRPVEPNLAATATAPPASALPPHERSLQEAANRQDAARQAASLRAMSVYADGLTERARVIEAQRRAGVEVLP